MPPRSRARAAAVGNPRMLENLAALGSLFSGGQGRAGSQATQVAPQVGLLRGATVSVAEGSCQAMVSATATSCRATSGGTSMILAAVAPSSWSS